jgi:hypothetical protein
VDGDGEGPGVLAVEDREETDAKAPGAPVVVDGEPSPPGVWWEVVNPGAHARVRWGPGGNAEGSRFVPHLRHWWEEQP